MDFIYREISAPLEQENCCNMGKVSLLSPSFIFIFHNFSFFVNAVIFSIDFQMCIFFPCKEIFNAFSFSKMSHKYANFNKKSTTRNSLVAFLYSSSLRNTHISCQSSNVRNKILARESHGALLLYNKLSSHVFT